MRHTAMDSQTCPDPGDSPERPLSPSDIEPETDNDSGIEDELRAEDGSSTIFVAFKGDIGDIDLQCKLERILQGVPDLISMESNQLKLRKVEPWNSVRVTFNIPREAAERLRLLAQGNNQQLRDLGILSVQIEGEGAINLVLPQNPAQEVRLNGPVAASNTMRIDPSFAVQNRAGLVRMNNPATVSMMSQGPHVSSAMITASGSADLQPRTPRPPSQQDIMDPFVSGLSTQPQSHPSGSLAPQIHPMQGVVANRPVNPANFQQFQQQQQQPRLPQHQQVSQGIRPAFATPAQVPVPPGWNQLASGALQPPPAQASMGTVASNQQWKKTGLGGGPLQQQQQFPQRPSLSTGQTPSHPPPPYPFGSQQASQVHSNFPSMANSNQFSSPPMKPMQGAPPRVLTPLQQPHLSKSPASSPSSFQQSSPASSPTVNQTQQQALGPRAGQGSTLPQGYQQQPVSSPGRSGMMPQGSTAGNFMMQPNQGPQNIHTGVPKRLPPGFPAGQANANFLQGQTPPSAAGSPANGGPTQTQTNPAGQATGGQTNGSSHSQMQGSHSAPNLMQTNLIGLQNTLNNQQPSGGGVSQVGIGGLHGQPQQGPQSQILGMHQQIISSQGQMVNIQGQAPLNTQGQLVLSRNQLMSQGQMLGAAQNLGQAPQRMTPPKQMIPPHNQMMVQQGQAVMQQSSVMEQIMQGNKQGFGNQNPAGVMAGPSQIVRGPTPGLANNMLQFQGQTVPQQSTSGGNPSQGVNMQGQVLRQAGPGQHLQQQHTETTAQTSSDLGALLNDISMQQQGNMAAQHQQHLQNMPGNGGPGQHFPGHSLQFTSAFGQGGNGNQLSCGQNPAFPVNKDVTLTSPLLVNLLQSDISAGHFGMNNKQNSNAVKPKKKKPPRKKKNQQGEEHMSTTETRMEDSDQPGIVGEHLGALEAGQKLSDFTNRPPGYPAQGIEQRQLQQIPPQLMQLGQQQGQSGQTPPQQMMMMLMMQQQQQQQQQDQKTVKLPLQQNVFNPRAAMNSDVQRMPMQQGGNLPVMVNLQGSGSIPPSPDKQRMSMVSGASLGSNGRKMGFPDSAQNQSGSPLGEGSSLSSLPDIPELPTTSGPQGSMAPHLLISQNPVMMSGNKPGAASALSLGQGTSPQQQHSNTVAGSHGHHYQSVQTSSQSSRPKTPNRASPRPYYPQTPNNRPPSTEPSEISLSPERLNASIAGLFPPQINIPLPPRPTLSRGFDQQGLNPTTLKAIGQAPPGLTVNSQPFGPQANKMDNGSGKPPNAGGNKRASPSNSRRSSPASSRKTTPSPGRQNSKNAKMMLGGPQGPGVLHSMEMQRNIVTGQVSMQNPIVAPQIGQYPPISIPSTSVISEENKESPNVIPESDLQTIQMIPKEQAPLDFKASVHQDIKMTPAEELPKKDARYAEVPKPPSSEELTAIAPAMREVPTSLSQLLDHSNALNVNNKPPNPTLETSLRQTPTEDSQTEIAALPGDALNKESHCITNLQQYAEPNPAQSRLETAEPNANVQLTLPGTSLKRPAGPTNVSTALPPPSQITVFVTSNPITTSASVSAPAASHLQPTLVPTVVTMPNVGNKVIVSEGQGSVQSSSRPQFITPVFFNSSSIIQVMKGSQQSNIPTSNPNLMPQSVAVVGPLHISQNIQFPGPPASSAPTSSSSSLPITRPGIVGPVQSTPQFTPSHSSSPLPPTPMPSSSEDNSPQLGKTPELCSPAPLQSTTSPALDNKPDTSTSKFLAAPSVGNIVEKDKNNTGDIMGAIPESSDANGSTPGRSTPQGGHISSENSSTSALSMDPVGPIANTPVDLLAYPSPDPLILADKTSEATLAERISTTFDETVPEQILETDPESQDTMESEPAERSRPPSRRNSRSEELSVPQDSLESGQRKRSARPSSASGSTKEPGASPPQPKRRKSK